MADNIPVILCFSGYDPSGGAGIQADIEAIAAHGMHAVPVITALTVQDSQTAYRITPVSTDIMQQQVHHILQDMQPAAIKIGMLGSIDAVELISEIISDLPELPIIFDPVLASGDGSRLSREPLEATISRLIVPHCNMMTPNTLEAHALTGLDNDRAAEELLRQGCKSVLLTGTHGNTDDVIHHLHTPAGHTQFRYPRLDGEYHGSGCTLAASLAASMLQHVQLEPAVKQALDYTEQTLLAAHRPGKGQLFPRRMI